MQRTITGFQLDEEGHWMAVLDCGHTRHMRHDPPWLLRPWVLEAITREKYIGTSLPCVKCLNG